MNYTPEEKEIAELFGSFSPTGGPRLKRLLADAPWTTRAVTRRRIIQAAVSVVAVMALLLAATPQGRALAQSIWQFFVLAGSDARSVPTLALESEAEGRDPYLELQLPFEDQCGEVYLARCSFEEIRGLVTFPLKGLGKTEQPMIFMGATGGPERVIFTYRGDGVNGTLSIFEEPVTQGDPEAWQVGMSADVEAVSINGLAGEYVEGGWFSIDTEDVVSWNADPFVRTLRWKDETVLYTMIFRAGKDVGITLDKATLLSMAESLIAEPASDEELAAPALDLEQLSNEAGFPVTSPSWLPDGYAFLYAGYTPDTLSACLYFHYGNGTDPVMAIAQRPVAISSGLEDFTISVVDVGDQQVSIPLVTEPVKLDRATGGLGTLVTNGVDEGRLCPQPDLLTNQGLTWEYEDRVFVIFGLLDQYEGGVFISRLEMATLARSLMGEAPSAGEGLDPERLPSVEAADDLASFDVKAPAQLVEGLQFDHAAFLQDEQSEAVKLVYSPSGGATRGGVDYGVFITQSVGVFRTLEEVDQWGGFEEVSVHGQPARYRKICWETMTGETDCRQELYWNEGGVGYDLAAYLPGLLEKDQFLELAEDMQ